MNTKISYMYRDGDNYKQYQDVVFSGEITDVEKKIIMNALDEGTYFIPSQVGLVDLQERMVSFPSDADHVWHELQESDITLVDEPPTDWVSGKTIQDLVNAFKVVKWDVAEATKDIGLE